MKDYNTYLVCCFFWNIVIFSTFTYLIFFNGINPWWYAFMILIGASFKSKKEFENDNFELETT